MRKKFAFGYFWEKKIHMDNEYSIDVLGGKMGLQHIVLNFMSAMLKVT